MINTRSFVFYFNSTKINRFLSNVSVRSYVSVPGEETVQVMKIATNADDAIAFDSCKAFWLRTAC